MTPSHKSILIVGGGLAGVFMAAESLLAGHEVTLFDQSQPDSASRVAAGLYNVVTGRRAVLTWRAQELLDTMKSFFGHPQFQPLAIHRHAAMIYRPFKTPGEYNDWAAKSMEAEYREMVRMRPEPFRPEQIHSELGGLEILHCGWLQTAAFIDHALELMETEWGLTLHRTQFDYRSLDPERAKANIGGREYVYNEVIFTEGTGIRHNPWWDWMDIRPLKGQILDVEIEGFDMHSVLLRKLFFIPKGNNLYTVGSTYEQYFQDPGPSKEGVEEISEGIRAAIRLPFRVVDARAGIRPTTPNRRPVWGRHPGYPQLYVLNGMGTKGVLQAPWAARQMRAWLDGQASGALPETSVERFLKKNS